MARDPRAHLAVVVVVEAPGPAVDACRHRYDPGARAGMPPHVTVLYPVPDPGRGADGLGETLGPVLVGHPPFRFWLRAIGRFPGVVYLTVDPSEPFVDLTEAVGDALGIAPYGGAFDQVVPHLTVAARRRLPRRVVRSLEEDLPIEAVARDVRVLAQSDGGWTQRCALPLGPPSAVAPPPGVPGSSVGEPPTSAGDQALQQ